MKYLNLTQPMQVMRRYEVDVAFFQKAFSKWLRLMLPPVILLAITTTAGAQTSGWTPVQNLNEARTGHTMTLLPDGRVLAAGGSGTVGLLASAELYDPATRTWLATGPLLTARSHHTATLLPNGKVLVAGGYANGTAVSAPYQYEPMAASGGLATAELYDPATGTWHPTGNLNTPRSSHSATLLPNGWVLVTGGCCDVTQAPMTSLKSAELYNPTTETWVPVASLSEARDSHSAMLLTNGSVLIAGGQYPGGNRRMSVLASAEIYTFDPANPAAGTWQPTGSMLAARSRYGTARLPDGTVMVIGGHTGAIFNGTQTAEVYDTVQKTWRSVGAMTYARLDFTATTLVDGKVLAAGGYNCPCSDPYPIRPFTEIYNPVTQTWTSAGNMNTPRYEHAAVLLKDGSVLVSGGIASATSSPSANVQVAVATAEVFGATSTPPPPVANNPPAAVNDNLSTNQGTPLTCSASLLLSNDSDPDGNLLTVTQVSTPSTQGGTITGSYIYTPPSDFAGTDTFTYMVSDGKGGTATGTVTVTVRALAANQSPVAVNDSYSTTKDKALTVAAPGLLANDSDPDGNALSASVKTPPANGTVSVAANGGFTYTPTAGFTGTDSFDYTISDGKGGNASARAAITIAAASLTPQTVFPTAVTITTGKFDYGTIASLKTSDGNTYDVNSAFVTANNGGVTDWYASTKVSGSTSAVTQLTMSYSGQYSKASVSQQVLLFNFTTNSWDLLDTRSVGNSNDVTVTVTPANPSRYLSSTGEMRARVRGYRAGAQSTTAWKFFCWANLLKWNVK